MALVAVGIGVLLLLVLQYFAFFGRIVVGVVFLFVFLFVLPPLVSLVLGNVPVFEGIGVDSEQPLSNLLDLLFD